MIWLFGVNDHMSPLETVNWLFEMLFWFSVTPLIIYFAQLLPLLGNQRLLQLGRQILLHLHIATTFYAVELLLAQFFIEPLLFLDDKQEFELVLKRFYTVFFLSLGTAFRQYMVHCYIW